MVSQHNLVFLFNRFHLFNYRHLKINSLFFLLWLKGSQRWYSGWSDHGFKSGLPLFKPPFGPVEFFHCQLSWKTVHSLYPFIGVFGFVITAVVGLL